MERLGLMSIPIIALHGNLGSSGDWDDVKIPSLKSIDLWEYSDLDYFEFAHELATTLSEGMEKPVIAGYSLGGRLALYAMAIHPARWGGAVIISAHPGLCCVEDRLARRVSDEVWATRARELPWDEFLEQWNAQPVLSGSPISPEQKVLESKRAAIAMAFETWSLGRQDDLRKSLRHFQAPVTWITGADDRKFATLGDEMADVFPNFRHEKLEGIGHRVLQEAPERVGDIFREMTSE